MDFDWTVRDAYFYSLCLLRTGASHSSDLRLGSVSSLTHAFLHVDDVLLILLHVGQDVHVVNGSGAAGDWVEQPDEEDQLEEEVEWDECQDESSELVDNVEEAEDNPVCEPLLVIISALRLESQEGHEAGVGNAEKASDVGIADAEHHEDYSSDKAVAGNLTWRQTGHLSNFLHFCRVNLKNLFFK